MAIHKKDAKALNYRDKHYLWSVRNRGGVNSLRVELSAAVDGQALCAELPRIISVVLIGEAIDFAYKNGWTPERAAPPLHCKYARKQFELVNV